MSKLAKTVAIVVSILIIISFAVLFIIKFLSITPNEGIIELKSDEINNEVKVKYNNFGVPYIYANNETDLFFGMGYTVAENRLWQIDYLRRIPQGKLSEIFGANFITTDKFFRTINFQNIVNSTWQSMDKGTKALLKSYSDGINFYIEKNISNLPIEFSLLNYKPQKWTPRDCLYILKFYAFEMNTNFWTDAIFGEIAKIKGQTFAQAILPTDFSLPKMNTLDSIVKTTQDTTNKFTAKTSKLMGTNTLSYNLNKIFNQIHILPIDNGCNCWALSSKINKSVKSALANDIHLPLMLPSFWMEMSAQSPTFHVTGFILPGIPFFIVGRNDKISWGLTNAMVDASDFFEEVISPDGKHYLSSDSTYKPLAFKIDTIFVKNSNSVRYYQRRTDKSIIISDFYKEGQGIDLFNKKDDKQKYNFQNLTFQWVGTTISDEMTALYKINKAQNWSDFVSPLNDSWKTPAVLFHYVDIYGNLGRKFAGAIPVRGNGNHPNFFNLASDKKQCWNKIEQEPNYAYLYDPANNYVSSANNAIQDSSHLFISNLFEPASRISRIDEYLNEIKDFDIRDMQKMQVDNFSYFAKVVMTICFPILNEYTNLLSRDELSILQDMKKWDFIMSANNFAPTVYNAFVNRLIYNTFQDELGDYYFNQYVSYPAISYNKILELLRTANSPLFDNCTTKEIENKHYIVFKSFRDGINLLQKAFRTKDYKQWSWGKIHKLELKNILEDEDIFSQSFSFGPLQMSGDYTTINKLSWNSNLLFAINQGVSMRFITDMHDSTVYVTMPGGNSGDETNINYNNQIRIWANGGYFKIFHTTNEIHSTNVRIIKKK
jgi:penicillin amidase